MATFTAFNLEPESDDEEIDDTKEIQIEDALKGYQSALKYQSQGPQYFPQAFQAYDTLLKSEIFKYPEALSEWQKLSSQPQEFEAVDLLNPTEEEALVPSNGNDSAPSTVPQIICLIYKNYGELIMKDLSLRLQDPVFQSLLPNDQVQTKLAMRAYAKQALQNFADALERDDTDLELWRKTAKLSGTTFRSPRLLRFCLESVLDQENDFSTGTFDRLNLDEKLAKRELLRLLDGLSDKLSIFQLAVPQDDRSVSRVLAAAGDLLPTFPELPIARNDLGAMRSILPATGTWAGVGWALMKALNDVFLGLVQFAPGTGFKIRLPHEIGISTTNTRPGIVDPSVSALGLDSESVKALPVQDQNRAQSGHVITSQPSLLQNLASSGAPLSSGQPMSFRPPSGARPYQEPTMILPNLKRSSGSAGFGEPTDGGRGRSKRIRARESNAEPPGQGDDGGTNNAAIPNGGELAYLRRLYPFLEADRYMINLMRDIYSKLGMDQGEPIDNIQELAELVNFKNITTTHPYTEVDRVIISDLTSIEVTWTAEKAQAISSDDESAQDASSASNLDIFLDHLRNPGRSIMNRPALSADKGLSDFLETLREKANFEWLGVHQICFRWLEALLAPTSTPGQDETRASIYIQCLWPAELKQVVAQMIVMEDEIILGMMQKRLTDLESRILEAANKVGSYQLSQQDLRTAEFTETLYELHLDIYSLITSPSSAVDMEIRIGQQDRLARWGQLAYSFVIHHRNSTDSKSELSQLFIRHMWAATLHAKVAEDASREHILLCLKDIRSSLQGAHNPVILLPNNAVMPEISALAIDQELSKVNTMDYFLKIFTADQSDPFMVIESLEPILDVVASEGAKKPSDRSIDIDGGNSSSLPDSESRQSKTSPLLEEMINLLDRGSTSLKLFLWRRLRDAYNSIGYTSKVVCCYLRSSELIIHDILAQKLQSTSVQERQISLLKSLRSLDELLSKVLKVIEGDPQSLQEVDYKLEESLLSALAALLRILYGHNVADDFHACGIALPATPNEGSNAALFVDMLNSIQARSFILQYILLKDCMLQNQELFPNVEEVLPEYLSAIHLSLGLRGQCRYSSKCFVRFALNEFISLGVVSRYRVDMAQVLLDLYGWKLDPEAGSHDCPAELLDRPTALLLVDFVLGEAKRYNIKDLVRSELRSMIDKMQQLIGGPDSSTVYVVNRRLLNAFFKSPINPARLYQNIQGIGNLSVRPVHTQSAAIAKKGWYFLLGHIALSRFKSQQRFSPTPTDDLDIAIAFFKQDLEHGSEKWETWYRLAQTFDAKLYEDLQWGADQINNPPPALVASQRSAIHCYGMAVATALRSDESSPEVKSQLFFDFGMRIYSSSREPLSMEAFSLAPFPRHYSNGENLGMYTERPFREMTLYYAWKFAAALFKHAIALNPKRWTNYYHLGKTLWKMLTCSEEQRGNYKPVHIHQVIKAFTKAIEILPEGKDSRQEPILEPHYKLVSIVHKLVYKGRLGPKKGSDFLLATQYARDLPRCDELDSWEPHILRILERLGREDKSNWHHRIVARAAHVIYDSLKDSVLAAMGAKHQFSQQIFTKTMAVQVWKPENETIGRHFVYTTRYVQFFVAVLVQLNDRAGVDAVVRKVRKKPADFFRFSALWEEICTTYLNLLRRQCHVPTGHEGAIFEKINYDDFAIHSSRVTEWINSHLDDQQVSSLQELIGHVNELKSKVNGGLMKPAVFDDLTADAYALLYEKALPTIMEEMSGQENRERMSINHLTTYDGAVETPPMPAAGAVPSIDPAVAARHRLRPVAKRDILRKAEALLMRPVVPAAPTLQPKPNIEISFQAPLPIREELLREAADAAAGSSVPGSVHDSADDESEVSEVDEPRVATLPLFPGLVSAQTAEESAVETEEEYASANEVIPDVDGEGEAGEGEVGRA